MLKPPSDMPLLPWELYIRHSKRTASRRQAHRQMRCSTHPTKLKGIGKWLSDNTQMPVSRSPR